MNALRSGSLVLLVLPTLVLAAPVHVPSAQTVEKAVSYGEDLRIEGKSLGDAVAYGGDLEITGSVEGNAVAFGGDLLVHGAVGGNVNAYGGNVVIAPGAKVLGRVTSVGGEVLHSGAAQIEGAVAAVGGSAVKLPDAAPATVRNAPVQAPRVSRSGVQELLLRFVVIFGLAFLVRAIAPRRIDAMERQVSAHPVRGALAGLLAASLLLPFSVLLSITGVGIPLAVALWFLFFAAVAVGAAAVVQAFGRLLPIVRSRRSQTVVLAAGALLLSLLALVPGSWAGWVVYSTIAFVGVGTAVLTRFGRVRDGIPSAL